MPGEGLLRRVNRFKRSILKLRRLKTLDESILLADSDKLDVLENNLRIAVEALLDVARFIIAAMDWERPTSYREAARILARHGVLDASTAKLLEELAGLRNVIVHMYADVDYERLVESLELVDSMEKIMASLLAYIEEHDIDP